MFDRVTQLTQKNYLLLKVILLLSISACEETYLVALKLHHWICLTDNWVTSFLSGHSHRTVLAGDESDFEFITASFIQGSGLGPASYDLHPVTEVNEMFKFADDTDLVIPARIIDSWAIEIQHVQTWATRNNLNLNCKKSHEIIFREPRSRST